MNDADVAYLEFLVKGLVDNTAEVRIQKSTDNMGILLTLHVDPKEIGKVIGKEGSTAKAIRHILKAFGGRVKARIGMKIDDPRNPPQSDGMGPGQPLPSTFMPKKSLDEIDITGL